MKKGFLFIAACLLISKMADAQQNKIFIQGNIGISFPLGQFAGKDFSINSEPNSPDGLANPGPDIELLGGYKINQNFSAVLMIGGSEHNQDKAAFIKGFGNIAGNNYQSTLAKWKILKMMVGGSAEIPLASSGKFSFKPSLFGGLSLISIPGYSYAGVYDNQSVYNVFRSSKDNISAAAFSYQIAAELKYQVAKKVYVIAGTHYFNAHPEHRYYTGFHEEYSLSSLTANIGIGYTF